MYSVAYRTKYNGFCYDPCIDDETIAKKWYLQHVWRGCRAVRLQMCAQGHYETVWETANSVINSIDNPNPTEDLPF